MSRFLFIVELCMYLGFFLLPLPRPAHAQAAEQQAPESAPTPRSTPWAGLPLTSLSSLGLGTPTLFRGESTWQAPITGGGFVRLSILPDPGSAEREFSFQADAATAMAAPPFQVWERDGVEARGDGIGLLLLRDHNVIIVVRHQQGGAFSMAEALRAALVTEAPSGTWKTLQERQGGEQRAGWDSCGRWWAVP